MISKEPGKKIYSKINGKIRIDIDKFLLLFIGKNGYNHKIPSIHFWCSIFFILKALPELEIVFPNGILKPKDCIDEIIDIFNNIQNKIDKQFIKRD